MLSATNIGTLTEIVSGGQTGADRAALDVAIAHDFPHSGWCPKGRKAEDGALDEVYQLKETASASYPARTRLNVRESDGTVVFTLAGRLSGGSLKTALIAQELEKPCLHICRDQSEDAAQLVRRFIDEHAIARLNVAGSRESKEPGVHSWVTRILTRALFP